MPAEEVSVTYKIAPGLVQLPESGEGFVRLTSGPYMTYGHAQLIRTVVAATARAVSAIAAITGQSAIDPSLKVVVKDLNTADGKAAKGHKTHGAGGKNVDIGYFYRKLDSAHVENLFINHKNLPYKVVGGARTLTRPHPLWDLEANWIMTRELLDMPAVSQVMVDELYAGPLEAKAKAYYAGDDAKLKRAMKVIQWYGNHDNHFHLTVDA